MQLTYTGEQPMEQTGLGLSWTTGQTQEVPDHVAQQWKDDPAMPFTTPYTKAGKEAAQVAAVQAHEPTAAADQMAETETEAPQ